MTRTFVLHLVETFFGTLNAQATRRAIMQYYTANDLALSGGFRGLWFLSSLPRVAALRHMVCLALEAYLPHLVSHIAKPVHVYSGSAIKHDGNYDMAALLTVATRNRQTGKYTQTHINRRENIALDFMFGAYEFKYDSGAFEKRLMFLQKIRTYYFLL